ncbi:MAG: (2Fe-2S)-binding protein [Candidatus Omnitrophica bacterium]|nr:(2Fe-2S)-binding protein [Candidatus Omnitrophota bacterium]
MAKLIIDNITYEVADGEQMAQACANAGIPFNCNSGVCGSCQIKILEGEKNINELNKEEMDLGLDRTHRLGCQCKILTGTVKATY